MHLSQTIEPGLVVGMRLTALRASFLHAAQTDKTAGHPRGPCQSHDKLKEIIKGDQK